MNNTSNNHLQEWADRYRLYRSYVLKYVVGRWDRWLLLLIILYIIGSQDIQLKLFINGKPLTAMLGSSDTKPQQMSLLSGLVEKTDEINVVSEPIPPPRPEPSPADYEVAKGYSNLGFVMNPGLTARKGLSPGVEEVKLRKIEAYLKIHASAAVSDMQQYGIPASIKLAQALLESNVGESRLASNHNNHFGIKCFSRTCKKGHCANFTDDSHKDFFRIYQNASSSFRAHSQFLQKQRYASLKHFGTKDYKSWAHGLKKAGYATDPRYAQKLITIIEQLKLYKYDA